MTNTIAKLLAAAVVSMPLIACGESTPSPASPSTAEKPEKGNAAPAIAGHWKSACTKTGDAQSITLDFTNTKGDWKLDYVTYGDATCKAPFVTVHIEGPYEIGAKSATVAGAWEGRFGFTKKIVTPHSDAAAGFLGSDKACGAGTFAAGKATDVLEKGCAGLGQYPSSKCSADYDLVSVEGTKLRFGDRPKDNDMCTEGKRPKALSGLAMNRVD